MVAKGNEFIYDGQHQEINHFYTGNGATWKGLG